MVGELPVVEPVLPVVRGPLEPVVGLLEVARRRVLAPRQGAEEPVALLHERPGRCLGALDAEVHVGDQPQLEVAALGGRDELVVARPGVLPRGMAAPVVEHRLAVQDGLHLAVEAAHRAQQDVIGVVVGRHPAVGVRAVLVVMPGTDEQRLAYHDPSAALLPARLEDHRAREVAASDRDHRVRRADAKATSVAIEDRPEDTRAVHPRQAQPFHIAARRHQRGRLAVGEEAVLGDGRERAAAPQNPVATDITNAGHEANNK